MNYVFDSSCLIYFGKLKILDKIKKLEGKKLIPQAVYNEVVKEGFERKEREVFYIEQLIKEKSFTIQKPNKIINNIPLLSEADREVLALAKEKNYIAIIDEIYAKNMAKSHNIETHGSLYLLLRLIEEKIISKKQIIEYIDKMISLGFYLSLEKYKDILTTIEKMS